MKRTITLIVTFAIILVFCPRTYAYGGSDGLDKLKQRIEEQLSTAVDENVAEELEDAGISPTDGSGITGIDQRSFFISLWDKFRETMTMPLVMLCRILAVSLICSAVSMLSADNNELSEVFGTLCIICAVTVMADLLSESFEGIRASVNSINLFMVSYIPVFAAVTTAGGQAATAGVYSASTILLCEVSEFIASKLLIPLLSAITALAIVAVTDPKLKISGVAESLRKLTTWLLATVMLIFVGLLTVQGVTGKAADDMVSRTLRFTASSFIPVIGGSVSDAFMAVRSGAGVIKAAVGGFGLLVVFLIAVRPFLLLISMKLTIWAGRLANELLGQQRMAEFFKSINSVLSIGASILIAITAAFIIATAALLAVMTGGG
ncbi:sporulation protein [uncultured Ruminococcus sp.]|uniref:stage III sporulation protein AE n=1 Tax=uncultured Ruminococcus sp. TaxID=165186 RepID=UPI0025ECEC0F|nr:sporulation protein [uncultured Ruminococcus sp.]